MRAETYLVNMHELCFGASIWVEVLPWALSILTPNICLGQQMVVINIKYLVPFLQNIYCWLYFSFSIFNKNCNFPAHGIEPGCEIESIKKDKAQ